MKSLLPRSVDSSLLLACGATAIYYAIMLQPSMHGTVLGRYTTKNPVDYAITFLFLWSLIDLAMKCLAFPGEMLSLRHEWLPERNGQQPVSDAAALIPKESELSGWQLRSRICSRITKALQYAVEHGVGQDYRDQIKYLSGKAEEETLARYSVVRFAIAITPMLGFLGTVVHFGTALSGISFEEMDSRLADVVSHMGEAFNTTTSALAAAMTAMFFLFLAERTDKGIDAAVDRYVERELETRFVAERKIAPELDGVQSAHDDALLIMRQTLERQVQLWTEALGGLFQQFEQRQAAEGAAWERALESLRAAQDSFEQRKEERLIVGLETFADRQQTHLEQVHGTLDQVVSLKGEFYSIGGALQKIADGEGRIAELQATLDNNLQTLQMSQKMDEAMHGLTAAIHLLTARRELPGARAA